MFTGNLIIDAITQGVVGTIAGMITKKAVAKQTVREFYRCGGMTLKEAHEWARELRDTDGWLPLSAPVHQIEQWGRDFCQRCFYERSGNIPQGIPAKCPRCGAKRRLLVCHRETYEIYTIELYRDVPA